MQVNGLLYETLNDKLAYKIRDKMRKNHPSKRKSVKKEVTFEDELSDRTRIKKQMENHLLTKATKRHDEDYNEY